MNLSDNMLVDITMENVDQMSRVKRLDLSYNKLSRIPPTMSRLTELSLSGNMIKNLDQSSFQGQTSLQVKKFLKKICCLFLTKVDLLSPTIISISIIPKLQCVAVYIIVILLQPTNRMKNDFLISKIFYNFRFST